MALLQPTVLDFFSDVPIVQATCGEAHTIVLDKWGRVFAFGWNQLGQLGVGKVSQGQEYHIHKVSDLPPVKEVNCGAIFSMAISVTGKVFVWGSGENGQLGLGIDIKESIIPMQLGVGTEFEKEHVISGI